MSLEWAHDGGINVGVLLLQPERELYQRVLPEVQLHFQPERIPERGSEQDYERRVYAPYWAGIAVACNYQLRRVLHSLDAVLYYVTAEEHLLYMWRANPNLNSKTLRRADQYRDV